MSALSLDNRIGYEYVKLVQHFLVTGKKQEAKADLEQITRLFHDAQRNSSGLEAALIEARITALSVLFARKSTVMEVSLGPSEIRSDVYDPNLAADLRKKVGEIDRQLERYAKIGRIPVLLMRLNRIILFAQTGCPSKSKCREVIRESEELDGDLQHIDAPALLVENIAMRVVLRTFLSEMTNDERYLCETFEVAEKAIAVPNALTAFEDYTKIITSYHNAFSLKQLRSCADNFQKKLGRTMLDEAAVFKQFPDQPGNISHLVSHVKHVTSGRPFC